MKMRSKGRRKREIQTESKLVNHHRWTKLSNGGAGMCWSTLVTF